MTRTAHLDLTEDGWVWLRCLPNAYLLEGQSCGFVGCPRWPTPILGDEPDWFWMEVYQLRLWWDEEQRIAHEEAAAELSRMTWDYYENCLTR